MCNGFGAFCHWLTEDCLQVASSLALQPTDCKVKEEIKADLVSSICGNRPPLVANGDISAAVCDFEALRLVSTQLQNSVSPKLLERIFQRRPIFPEYCLSRS